MNKRLRKHLWEDVTEDMYWNKMPREMGIRVVYNSGTYLNDEKLYGMMMKKVDMIFNNRMKIHEEMVERVGWM